MWSVPLCQAAKYSTSGEGYKWGLRVQHARYVQQRPYALGIEPARAGVDAERQTYKERQGHTNMGRGQFLRCIQEPVLWKLADCCR